MKRILLGTTMILLLLSVSACTGLTALSQAFNFATDEEVFSFAAISTSSLLSESVTDPLLSVDQTITQLDTLLEDPTTDPTIAQIEPYLEMFETLLAQNNGLNVSTEISDLENYETKIQFTVYDLLNNPMVYTMYYNTVLLTDNQEVNDTSSTDDSSEAYEINGILLIGTLEYQITGRKELEDGEEKISFKSYIDENNYVLSKYKVEDNEKKFSITVVENGLLVTESKIKVEFENGETSIKLEYTQGLNTSSYSFKYEVENGTNLLKIKYDTLIDGTESSGSIKVEVIYDELTNVATYQIYVEPDHEEAYEHASDRNMEDREDHEDDDHDDHDESDDFDDDNHSDQDETQEATDYVTS